MGGPERPHEHLHGGDAMRIDSGTSSGFTGGLQNGISAALALQSSSRLERAGIATRVGSFAGSFANTRPTVNAAGPIGGSASAIGDLGRQLAELRTLIERGDGKGPGLGLDMGEIERLAAAVDRALGGASQSASPYVIDDVDFVVANPEVTRATIPNGGSVDVSVSVAVPGERAGLFMNFQRSQLDLNTGSAFVVELGTQLGSVQLSFGSGTSLDSIVQAINTEGTAIGLRADVERSAPFTPFESFYQGIKVTSFDLGEDAIVSVRVIDDGGANASFLDNQFGVMPIGGEPGSLPDIDSALTFATMARNGLELSDRGEDMRAFINGYEATVSGQSISIDEPELAVSMDLRRIGFAPGSRFGANFTGFGRAFTIRAADDARLGAGGQSLLDGVGSGDREGSLAAIDRLLDALGADARRPGLAFDGRG